MELVKRLLFFDIETVGLTKTLEDLKEVNKGLYDIFPNVADFWRRRDKTTEELSDDELYAKCSGLIPEYSRVVCVSFGFYNEKHELTKYSVFGDDEVKVLTKAKKVFDHKNTQTKILCGHNVIDFDLDTLAKRYLYHGLDIPERFPKSSQPPWVVEKMVLDTKREYMGNRFKPSSLNLLCAFLGVESPKDGEVSGNNMHEFYWDTKDLEQISFYCERDIQAQHDITKILIEKGIIDEQGKS